MERKSKNRSKRCRQNRKRKNDQTTDFQHCPGSSFLFTSSKSSACNASHSYTPASSSDHGNIASRNILSPCPSSGLSEQDSSKTSSSLRTKESASIDSRTYKASKKIKQKKKHHKLKRLRKTDICKNSMGDSSDTCREQCVIPPCKESEPVEHGNSTGQGEVSGSAFGKQKVKSKRQHPAVKGNQSGGHLGECGVYTHSQQNSSRGCNMGWNQGAKKLDYQRSQRSSHQEEMKGSSHRKKKIEHHASNQEAHGGGNTASYHHYSKGKPRGWSNNSYSGGFQGNPGGSSRKRVPKSTATNTSQSGASSSLEIPGFYYDADKKRYFKIQDSGNSIDEDFITKESIAKAKAESQRQKDLETLHKRISTKHMVPSTSTGKTLHKPANQSVFSLLLNGFQRGEVNTMRLRRAWVLGSAANLRPTGNCHVFAIPEFHQNLEHMIQMETSKESDKLLCLWSLTGTLVERLQLVTVNGNKRTYPGELALDFSSSDTTVLQSWNKITNVCWSDFKQFPDKKYVLYTTRCHTGRTQSLAFIRNLDPSSHDEVRFFDFNLGSQMTWTCAWNFQKQQFGVGTEKGCLVIDVNTRRLWQFKTNKSDALAQIFTKEDGGNTMYTGTRRGSILKHDLRSSSTQPIHLMSHPTSVVCVRLSPEENYLYASDFSGNIRNWDLRMNKVVLNYNGLFNMQSKLPFHIDETQSLLYGAGQDCYTKIWCLRSGRLLHSIPPPYETSLYSIPAIQFSSHWAGVDGNVGLIMGAHKSFYLYGPKSQNE